MEGKYKRLENIGSLISSLGGLILVLNLTLLEDNAWDLELSILAAVLAVAGLFIILWAKRKAA